jgi:predicted nucleic acid-binding protein
MRAVDANVLLRFVLGDHADHSARAAALLQRVEAGDEQVYVPEVVVSDTVWTLASFYDWPRDRTRDFLTAVLQQPSVHMRHKARMLRALDLFVGHNVDYSDALIAAELAEGSMVIYSFDRHFGRLPDVERIEPH